MGKGPGQDGKLSASKRSNGWQQADVLEAQRVYVSRFGSRTWRDNQEGGGWHQGFWKQAAHSAALTQDLISFKYWSNTTALQSQTTKVGIQRQSKQTKGHDLKPGFKVNAAPA